MNTALAIASREVRDKTRLFLVAAVLAVLPFLATLLPTSRGWDQRMIVGMFGGTLAVGLGLGLAVALGAATIGRELSDRRLSFYFSKPVSPAAIWIGKASANLFTVLACFAIVGVPALLVSSSAWGATWPVTQGRLVGMVAAAAVALFLISHTLSTMIRSRSALIAADLVLLALTGYGVFSLVRPLLAGSAMEMAMKLLAVLFIALLMILAVGPVRQLSQGRTDVQRNHQALSRFVWPAVLVVFLGAAAYVAWVVHPAPSDLTHVGASQSPGGKWVMVGGTAEGRGEYQAAMLINTADGRLIRTPMPWSGVAYSRDGKVAVWASVLKASDGKWPPTGNGWPQLTLQVANLDGQPRIEPLGLRVANTFVVSDDGSRFASIDNGTISVHDLGADRLLASVRGLNPRRWQELIFVRPDLVRIWQHDATVLSIWELDVARKTLTKTGQTEEKGTVRGLSANADGSRLLLHDSGKVVDGRTGAVLYQVAPRTIRGGSSMLADGTVMVTDEKSSRVQIYQPDGAPGAAIALPGPLILAGVAREIEGGKVVMVAGRARDQFTTMIVDVKRGVIERSADVRTWQAGRIAFSSARLSVLAADAPIAVVTREGKLALWNAKTGEQKQL